MSPAAILREAPEIITPKAKWTQGALARDAKGNEVKPSSDLAKAFDMVGALQRVQCRPDDYGTAILILRRQCGKRSIFDFNDAHGQRAVLKCMGRAIRAAEQVAA